MPMNGNTMSKWEKTKLVLWVLTLCIAIVYAEIYRRDLRRLRENSDTLVTQSSHLENQMKDPLGFFARPKMK